MSTYEIVLIVIGVLFAIYVVIEIINHKCINYTSYDVSTRCKLKLCVISDLHNCRLPKSAIKRIAEEKPDYIILAGDIINQKNYDVSATVKMFFELSKIATIFYCYGNHERKNELYTPLEWENFKAAVSSLCEFVDDEVQLNDEARLYGINLSRELYDNKKQSGKVPLSETNLNEFPKALARGYYNIVVCHTPAYADYLIKELSPELIISGHLHGGHIRLPFIGGIIYTIIPRPKYREGLYKQDNTNVFVSRGAGTHFIPVRFNNHAEITFLKI